MWRVALDRRAALSITRTGHSDGRHREESLSADSRGCNGFNVYDVFSDAHVSGVYSPQLRTITETHLQEWTHGRETICS